jgi:DNA-binding NarL/FixJ family response regulator
LPPEIEPEPLPMTRILLADDHEVVRTGVRRILEGHQGWEVVGEAANGKEAIDKAIATTPDVAILDYAMPLLNGMEAARQIRQRLPTIEIVMLTMYNNEAVVEQLLRIGVRGFVDKADAGVELAKAVRSVAQGRPFFTGHMSHTSAGLLGRRRTDRPDLTVRERDVLRLIAEGHTSKQISTALGISQSTVEVHRHSIKRKLEVETVAGLVRYAFRKGIVKFDA